MVKSAESAHARINSAPPHPPPPTQPSIEASTTLNTLPPTRDDLHVYRRARTHESRTTTYTEPRFHSQQRVSTRVFPMPSRSLLLPLLPISITCTAEFKKQLFSPVGLRRPLLATRDMATSRPTLGDDVPPSLLTLEREGRALGR